jgi:spore maturation protein CgeB
LFEIPAAGAFMLAQRGQGEPLEFFKEGEEMACFGDVKELREKISHYLTHDEERYAIQVAGQRRVLGSGYLAPSRLERVLQVYRELKIR